MHVIGINITLLTIGIIRICYFQGIQDRRLDRYNNYNHVDIYNQKQYDQNDDNVYDNYGYNKQYSNEEDQQYYGNGYNYNTEYNTQYENEYSRNGYYNENR